MKSIAVIVALLAGCNQSRPEEAKEPPPPVVSGSAGSAAIASASKPISSQPIAPYHPSGAVPDSIKAAISAPDRSEEDRRLDAGRKPGEVLAFFGVAPGMKIGELFAGAGYTTELLARVAGSSGVVYAQNTKEAMDKLARKPLSERAGKAVMQRVVVVERPIDAPFPPEAKQLDLVITVLNYHDAVHADSDRAAMNKAVYAALKKGGVYAIVDSNAQVGSGGRDAGTLHRIDESLVKSEVGAAGFTLAAESEVLRNPSDPRDWNSSPDAAGPKRGTSDRFVLKFVK